MKFIIYKRNNINVSTFRISQGCNKRSQVCSLVYFSREFAYLGKYPEAIMKFKS